MCNLQRCKTGVYNTKIDSQNANVNTTFAVLLRPEIMISRHDKSLPANVVPIAIESVAPQRFKVRRSAVGMIDLVTRGFIPGGSKVDLVMHRTYLRKKKAPTSSTDGGFF